MSDDSRLVRCGYCGEKIPPHYAPGVRVWESAVMFFCSRSHAEGYVRPSPATPARLTSPPTETPDPKRAEALLSEGPEFHAAPPLASALPDRSGETGQSLPPRQRFSEALSRSPGPAREVARVTEPWELLPFLPLTLGALMTILSGAGTLDVVATWTLAVLFSFLERRFADEIASAAERDLKPLRKRLLAKARTVQKGHLSWSEANDLLPGEEIEVQEGEVVPADGVVVHGSARMELYGADVPEVTVQSSSAVIGGRRIISGGPLRIVANRTGRDRAFAQLLHVGKGSLIDDYVMVRAGRWIAFGFAPILAIGAGLLAFTISAPWPRAISIGAATWLVWSSPLVYRALRKRIWWVLAEAAERGIVFPRASVLEAAGHVGTAVFCTRGTLLRGDPVVSEIHSFRDVPRERVLALAAGALRSVHHPAARATWLAAEGMNLTPEPCRSHNPGVGASVRCLGQDGEEVIVGGRDFLLKHKISIAWTEERLRAIEGEAQTALVVAEKGHAIGIIALSDELLPGARATMQTLLAHRIEPALLSGGSRDTLEAIARRLGIDHVRAESTERKEEIERLRTAGVPVAVIGRLGMDDRALSGADVPILHGGISSFSPTFAPRDERRSVSVYSPHLPTCAQAILIAHELRQRSIQILLAHSIPAALGTLSAALEVTPIATIPGLALVGFLLTKRLEERTTLPKTPADP